MENTTKTTTTIDFNKIFSPVKQLDKLTNPSNHDGFEINPLGNNPGKENLSYKVGSEMWGIVEYTKWIQQIAPSVKNLLKEISDYLPFLQGEDLPNFDRSIAEKNIQTILSSLDNMFQKIPRELFISEHGYFLLEDEKDNYASMELMNPPTFIKMKNAVEDLLFQIGDFCYYGSDCDSTYVNSRWDYRLEFVGENEDGYGYSVRTMHRIFFFGMRRPLLPISGFHPEFVYGDAEYLPSYLVPNFIAKAIEEMDNEDITYFK